MLEWLVKRIAHVPRMRSVLYQLFLSHPDRPRRFMGNLRASYWRELMIAVGDGVRISNNVKILGYETISIGNNTHITNNCVLDGSGGLKIGDDVLVGFQSIILPSSHQYQDACIPVRLQGVFFSPVTIGDDVWLGTRVIVLPGILIGKGSIIGAGAVVSRDIPPYTIAAGVPAKPIGMRQA